LDKGMIHGVYFVNMQMDKKIEAGLLKKPFAFWFLKLQDSLSDFAAAVLLSYLYKKEATLIKMVAGDRGKWLRIKEDELSAWAEFFKKRTR
jgi:hypothetical protein